MGEMTTLKGGKGHWIFHNRDPSCYHTLRIRYVQWRASRGEEHYCPKRFFRTLRIPLNTSQFQKYEVVPLHNHRNWMHLPDLGIWEGMELPPDEEKTIHFE